MTRKAKVLFFIGIFGSSPCLFAQDTDMFIEQISGKTIVRKDFQRGGKLTGKQIFTAENMKRVGKDFLVNVNTRLYDEDQRLKSTYTTAYRCSPGESSVLLSVFAVNPSNKNVTVAVESGDFKNLYALDHTTRHFQELGSVLAFSYSPFFQIYGGKRFADLHKIALNR